MSLLKYQIKQKELKERLMRAEFPEFITKVQLWCMSHLDISMMKNMYAATWNTSQEVRVRFRLRWTFGRKESLRRH